MPLNPLFIQKRRESLGITLEAAAAKAMMTKAHWVRYESGKRTNPELATVERIAKVLRCSVSRVLMHDSDYKHKPKQVQQALAQLLAA